MKFSLLLLLVAVLFYSCKCSCKCEKDLGCRTMSAKLLSTDSLLVENTYCSDGNYYTDKVLADSTNSFTTRWLSDSTFVSGIDSIFKHEHISKVECDDRDLFEDRGYGCSCDK